MKIQQLKAVFFQIFLKTITKYLLKIYNSQNQGEIKEKKWIQVLSKKEKQKKLKKKKKKEKIYNPELSNQNFQGRALSILKPRFFNPGCLHVRSPEELEKTQTPWLCPQIAC